MNSLFKCQNIDQINFFDETPEPPWKVLVLNMGHM